ncbi:type II toxin-antitoxin system VapC family toxin [Streptomyces sp. NBC_01077]|uniref:type II toxin-antitoxin system VapC family toxin n=1 Tax=Streptomyces sp. NBC_01077 TaxID=2903746 RepID=UPI003866129B|nr:type II toxin-antitoxin system VapC family toxin [Streptomyces sp. NBC_01077]
MGERLLAPYLVDIEVTSALLGRHRGGELTARELDDACAGCAELPLRRSEQLQLLPRVRELYANPTADDATYVALVEGYDVPLVTSDARILDGARATRTECPVEVFDEKVLGLR